MALTPMLQQYFDIKKQYPNEILFFRLGDFYEMFGEDALVAAKILQIALTARNKGTENEIPMCGIPHHAVQNYLVKLTKAKKRVAICEQVSDPNEPGIVQREVVRVVTPGTTFDEGVLNEKENNFLAAVYHQTERGKTKYGMAVVDYTTGEFHLADFYDIGLLLDTVYKINPGEVLVSNDMYTADGLQTLWQDYVYTIYEPLISQTAEQFLIDYFKVKNLHGFGVAEQGAGIFSAARLLNYLQETQKTELGHLTGLQLLQTENIMYLDRSTIRNLELFQTTWDASSQGSLLSVIDHTQTAMGGRLLRQWLLQPLADVEIINKRLSVVELFVTQYNDLQIIREQLDGLYDIERLLAKIGCGRAHARDIVALRMSLERIPQLKNVLDTCEKEAVQAINNRIKQHAELAQYIKDALLEEPAITVTEGNVIADGFDVQVDEYRMLLNSGKELLENMQQAEREKTGINTLKIKFNKVFGYYLEVSKGQADNVPDNYIRKQTLTNAERYITPELKEHEDKVLNAQTNLYNREFTLFNEIRETVAKDIAMLQASATALAQLDVLTSFAYNARQNNYTKPEMTTDCELKITNGRHPVIEQLLGGDAYIPNNTDLTQDTFFALLTGPNMSGKSSYLRQNALIVLMAHLGSFVPAEHATIGITDRIFTRVGAGDNMSRGDSTFMVEMQEAGTILHNATEKSLIIFDELGRGTSTYDGLSLAWAITEYVHDEIKAKTLFATHYHELINVVSSLDHAINLRVAVEENDHGVVFLHKVLSGGVDKSYGVEVARIAGLPQPILQRATEILEHLEQHGIDEFKHTQKTLPLGGAAQIVPKKREPKIDPKEILKNNPVIKKIQTTDPNNLTPIEALNILVELHNEVKE